MNDDAEPGTNSGSSEAGLFCVITPDLPDESFRGRKLRVPAFLRDGEVGCSPAKLSYTPSIPRQNYSLELTRGNDVIDKTTGTWTTVFRYLGRISVTVYKCQEMASDCSQCLSLDPKWRCVWCDGGCHYHEQCSKVPDKPRADALCTQPVILSVSESSPARNLHSSICHKSIPFSSRLTLGLKKEARLSKFADAILARGYRTCRAECSLLDQNVTSRSTKYRFGKSIYPGECALQAVWCSEYYGSIQDSLRSGEGNRCRSSARHNREDGKAQRRIIPHLPLPEPDTEIRLPSLWADFRWYSAFHLRRQPPRRFERLRAFGQSSVSSSFGGTYSRPTRIVV